MNNVDRMNEMFRRDVRRNIFPKHIEYIRFPFFKKFEKNLKINFDSPITFVTGTNGTGKSSLLHAMYGSPKGNSISEFWFNTALDPISEIDNNRHCFICGFKTEFTKTHAEILKTRIKRKDPKTNKLDMDYWEPSRPVRSYGMSFDVENTDKRETTKTRWKLQERKVYYMDFRYSLSAFDKYFYFGTNPKSTKAKTKQDIIRKHSIRLKNAFDLTENQTFYNKSTKGIQMFTDDAINEICEILGKNYIEAKYLEHNFYDGEFGFAIKYRTNDISYSEAFAGSGEIAVAKLVNDLINVEENSLILLDEPETSLHPKAQKKLIDFIVKKTIEKKLQVIISTHSPDILEGMAPESIKVMYENEKTGRISVHNNVHSENAFVHIGHSITNRKKLIVEDDLAKLIVDTVLKKTGNSELFSVEFSPGGESTIKQENMVVYSKTEERDRFIIFDGDQRVSKVDLCDLSENDKSLKNLKRVVKNLVNQEIKFNFDSGDNHDDQEIQYLTNYIKYHLECVYFLPQSIPEEIIWNEEFVKLLISDEKSSTEIIAINSIKKRFNEIAKILFDDSSSKGQRKVYELFVTKWASNTENNDFQDIVSVIDQIKKQV